ncbi:HEPN family nuclease [uncultured Tenacibaculum sp.]|uniref:HEPN family nuclease n=1 Tax=uncultured Tenacibaculum sp. TaxID=174713 RepID=UPI00261257E9|nr:HEPN family nuclease [uncultured Tenacibaculum sp.]
MDKSDLKQIIANQFQINSLLGLIYDNAREENLTELIDQFKKLKRIDLGKYPLYNQHTMISSLYTFIALPKEVIWNDIPKKMTIKQLNEKWGFKNGWKIKNDDISNLKFRYLIRRLRNGINHGKINCNEKLVFTITDIDPRNNNDRIDFEIECKSLDKFSRALGFWIMTEDIGLKEL